MRMKVLMSLCLLALLPSSAAFGQKRIRADIPFDFHVSGKLLPAGEYRFIRADDNKSVLLMIGKGDQSAPNPTTTDIVRAGYLAGRTLYYRHDLYSNLHPNLDPNPHAFATNVAVFGEISQGVQDMIGEFFFSDGVQLNVPEPSQFFEFPIPLPLPEDLNNIAP